MVNQHGGKEFRRYSTLHDLPELLFLGYEVLGPVVVPFL
jgi:hypothetical protein